MNSDTRCDVKMIKIIVLLLLPVMLKLFTRLGVLKLKRLPRKVITAEMIVNEINRKKIRSCKVEQSYNIVYKNFHDKLKAGELTREQLLAVREYLKQNVHQYPNKKFKNDAHAIYTMLNARDIDRRDLAIVQQLIS